MKSPIRTGLFHYVPFAKIDDFHRRGWMIVTTLPDPHGFYAVLMWRCDCEI